jgi:hypothetical protein
MVSMKRLSLVSAAGAVLLLALAPASALAAIVELGATKTPITTPTCPAGVKPSACTIVLTETTGLETIRDGVTYPTTVKKAGYIVAWTIGLASLSSNRTTAKQDVHILDQTYGGVALARIVVLKPGPSRRWTVVSASPTQHLIPFLGTVVQFPLSAPLAVTPGETIGLAVPTWAPVLDYNLPVNLFAYRQSRTSNCTTAANTQSAQQNPGDTARYLCDYPGTRVEYSATEVTNPVPPKNHL